MDLEPQNTKKQPKSPQKQQQQPPKADEMIDAEWICTQVDQILRCLTGGLDILGLLVLCDKKQRLELQVCSRTSLYQITIGMVCRRHFKRRYE